MKSIVLKTAQFILPLAAIMLAASTAGAQTSCNFRNSFVGSAPSGEWYQIFDNYCNSTKTEYQHTGVLGYEGRTIQVTATNAARWPNGRVYSKIGGKTSCSVFEKKIVITFSEPVADLVLIVSHALTATDNRGYTVSYDSPSFFESWPNIGWYARFPGTGITSVTVTNPVSWRAPAPDTGEIYWMMSVDWGSFVPASLYKRCNCEAPTVQPPPLQTISTTWPFNLDPEESNPNWSMKAEVSEKDGLVLRDIKLGDRYMAEKINLPYYYLQTTLMANTKGELKPNSTDPSMRSRLVDFNVMTDDEKLVVEAKYSISEIPAGTQSCLQITQRYEFYKSKPGDHCEPSGTLPCSRWKPSVSYKFFGRNEDFLGYITIPQRQRLAVHGNPNNTVGIFRDCENSPFLGGCYEGLLISKRMNPLHGEWSTRVMSGGKSTQEWDNFHQTDRGVVDEPGIGFNFGQRTLARPGCPECVHNHWRWSAASGGEGHGHSVGLPPGSQQDLDVAVFRYNPGEEHPDWFLNLHNNEKIRTWFPTGRSPLQVYRDSAPDAPVLWYSAGSNRVEDSFFNHGHFYNPALPGRQLYNASTSSTSTQSAKDENLSSAETALAPGEDGVSSIVSSEIFVAGTTSITSFTSSLGGSLPVGYTQYSGLSYDVTSTAKTAGPHTITFSIPTVTDQNTFNNLRVFHLEQDAYSPNEIRWVDRTVLSPDPEAPDFVNKTINARTNRLGQFVVATLAQPQPPSTATADIVVTASDSPDGVVVGNNLTYTITVANIGPQTASGVDFSSSLAPDSTFISANSTQGTCSHTEGDVVCKLNAITSGTNAVVTIVVRPTEAGVPVPAQGRTMTITSSAKAIETDINTNNNVVSENTTVLSDGNTAPSVSIDTPINGSLLVGPANILIDTTAADSDGSITKVELFGDGAPLGTGTFTTANRYIFAWNNVSYGTHSIYAVATDNLGKIKVSTPVTVVVNGSATIAITRPTAYSTFGRPVDITITANASDASGSITKVDFFANGALLGTGTFGGSNQYSLTWNNAGSGVHSIVAIATDSAGITTTSSPVNITVNDPPSISLVSPANGAVINGSAFTQGNSVTLQARASAPSGIEIVHFYANGAFVGATRQLGSSQFTFTWSGMPLGAYTLTAVATANSGLTTTSAPVSIVVNTPPTVTLSSPANGTNYNAPASIAMTANASDSDGSIGSVNFFANGAFIGTGTLAGPNQYTFSWTNVTGGNYSLTAVATDNRGGNTTSAPVNVSVSSPALLVAGSTTLNSSDAAIKARLEALNYVVTVKAASSSTTADATGKAVVVISSTVTPTSVGTKFRTVAVPVVTWETGLFANMGMTGSTNNDFGTITKQTQVKITNPTHPLAAGLSGNVTIVAASGTLSWGKPNANAVSAATTVSDVTKKLIFGYEQGVAMPGLVAPARRVGLFMSDTTAAGFTTNGSLLFDTAIKWATGRI